MCSSDLVAGAAMGDAAQKLSDAVTPALADLGAAIDAGNLNGVDVQGIQNNALLQVGAAYNTGVKTLTGQLQDRVDRTERQRLLSLLEALGLAPWFEAVVVSSQVGAAKPDPRPFQRALELLQLPPEAAWHIGDSPEDETGARAAGLRCLLIRRPKPAGTP